MRALDRLAARMGIAASYRDQEGRTCVVPEATKRAILSAMGIDADSETQAEKALAELEHRARTQLLEPVSVLREDCRPYRVRLTLPPEWDKARLTVRLQREGAASEAYDLAVADLPRAEAQAETGQPDARHFRLPDDLACGYHAIEVRCRLGRRKVSGRASVIVVPSCAYQPPALAQRRIWGVSFQLYAVRSARNWGIGDFTDLRELMIWAGRIGAAAIGTNPLHALFLDDPLHVSPYSPSSRSFINPLYLDVEAVEEYASCEAARTLVQSAEFQARLAAAREAPLVDYPAVTAAKRTVLELLHRHLRSCPGAEGERRRKELREFREAGGEALQRFAVFQALREAEGAIDTAMRDWRRWPPPLRDPASAETRAFAESHEAEVEFFAYLQWQAAIQLADCAEAGRSAGLPIGLYLDLAVGTDAAGADAWAAPDLVATGASIGAPPDTWNRNGQNWGLPPLNMAAMRREGFRPFAELLRANMRWAGALRIDHVLGLKRLFWIPEGGAPADGGYVAYPFEELVGIVALESHRNRCLVIGEDLGTVPEGFQAAMRRAGLLSCCLLYFERDDSGRFRAPHEYPEEALVSITTHDLPTIWGFWSRHDLDEKERVGAYPDAAAARASRRARSEEIDGLIEALMREGLIRPGHARHVVPFSAILQFIARTRSRFLMIGIEDLLGVKEQPNLPGTIDEHPNWRRRLPLELADIKSDERVAAAIEILNRERPPSRPTEA